MKEIMEWVKDILLAVVIAAVFLAFFKPIIVQQQSMEPNFHAGDYLITSRQAYRLFGDPQRGDVIVFKSELLDENEKPKNLIKRIIALPGETIEIKGGEVYIDGQMLQEDYLPGEAISGEMDAVTVPEGQLFVMGDNRNHSADSRYTQIGVFNTKYILGKVLLVVWPGRENTWQKRDFSRLGAVS